MSLVDIKTSLYSHLNAQIGLPPIFMPNSTEDLPTENFIRPAVLPATTDTIGLNSLNQEIGIFQVSIYVKKGTGDLEAARIANTILTAFPRNLSLTGVRIDEIGSINPSFLDGNWQITPVSIPYQNIL